MVGRVEAVELGRLAVELRRSAGVVERVAPGSPYVGGLRAAADRFDALAGKERLSGLERPEVAPAELGRRRAG